MTEEPTHPDKPENKSTKSESAAEKYFKRRINPEHLPEALKFAKLAERYVQNLADRAIKKNKGMVFNPSRNYWAEYIQWRLDAAPTEKLTPKKQKKLLQQAQRLSQLEAGEELRTKRTELKEESGPYESASNLHEDTEYCPDTLLESDIEAQMDEAVGTSKYKDRFIIETYIAKSKGSHTKGRNK